MGNYELSLEEQYDIFSNQRFGHRVAMAFYMVAREVLEEDPAHPLRVNFARQIILQSPEQFVHYSGLLISDPDIRSQNEPDSVNISDEAIVSGVREIWNSLAGVDK